MRFVINILFVFALVIFSTIADDEKPYQLCTDAPPGACGPNADCFDSINRANSQSYFSKNRAYCKCKSNAFGKPPNCELYCKNGCKKGEYCDFGEKACKPGCKYSSECDEGQYCRWEDNKCTNGCDSDDRCNSDEYCNFDSNTCHKGCRSSEDCPSEYHCEFETHTCSKGCRNDNVCQTDEFCNNEKQCEKGCRGDSSCKIGEFCNVNTKNCVEGCFTNTNCQMDEYCNETESKCWKGCWEDEQCKSDEFCDTDENECKTGCRDDTSCNDGQYCDEDSRKCAVGCTFETESCPENEICDSETRKCKEGCSKCQNDEYCNKFQGDCHKICTDDLCGPNSICTVLEKNAYCSCSDGYVPEKNVGCVKKTETYIEDEDCTKTCAKYGGCEKINGKIHCFCPIYIEFYNSFVYCPNVGDSPPLKPSDESEISLAGVIALSG